MELIQEDQYETTDGCKRGGFQEHQYNTICWEVLNYDFMVP